MRPPNVRNLPWNWLAPVLLFVAFSYGGGWAKELLRRRVVVVDSAPPFVIHANDCTQQDPIITLQGHQRDVTEVWKCSQHMVLLQQNEENLEGSFR